MSDQGFHEISPRLTLAMVTRGYFPMADSRDGRVNWYTADPRAILPMDDPGPHWPRSLRRLMRRRPFEIRFNHAFEQVIRACAQPRRHESQTWINHEIIDVYTQLHRMGFGQSCECWHEGELVGGIYGLHIGRAFFAESMFSHISNASKVALATLVTTLREAGLTLFDVQFSNPHLEQFGVVEIPAERYGQMLDEALRSGLMPAGASKSPEMMSPPGLE